MQAIKEGDIITKEEAMDFCYNVFLTRKRTIYLLGKPFSPLKLGANDFDKWNEQVDNMTKVITDHGGKLKVQQNDEAGGRPLILVEA